MRLRITPALAVRGRTSGESRTARVNALELAGQRYRVAPRGTRSGSGNVRATGRGELRWRGLIEPFRSIEIADDEKPRIIKVYRALGGYQG